MGIKREANVVIVGNYQVGKTNIASTFTGADRESSVQRIGWSEQMIMTKNNDVTTNAQITIKGSPMDFGRMTNHRLREQTYKEANGYIVVFQNTDKKEKSNKEKFDFEWYLRPDKKPTLMIGTVIDGNTKKNPEIEKFALAYGAPYIVLDTTKLSDKDGDTFKLMEKSIRNLVFKIFGEPLITDDTAEKKVAEKKEVKAEEKAEKPTAKLSLGDIFDNVGKIFKKVGKVA